MKAFILCCFFISVFTSFEFIDTIIGGFACSILFAREKYRANEENHGNKRRGNAKLNFSNLIDDEAIEEISEINPETGLIMQPGAWIDTGGSLPSLTMEDTYS